MKKFTHMLPLRRLGSVLAALTGVALLAVARPAAASSVTYMLMIDHCSSGCGGNGTDFVHVTLNDNTAGQVTVTVTPQGAFRFVNTGLDDTFDFNLTGVSGVTFSNFSAGFSINTGGPHHFDGFGDFDYSVHCNSCGSGGSNPQTGPISFIVTASGINNNSFIDFSSGGSANVMFGADIITPGPNPSTGPVGGNTCIDCATQFEFPPVPEPSTIALFGTGLSLAALGLRRRRP